MNSGFIQNITIKGKLYSSIIIDDKRYLFSHKEINEAFLRSKKYSGLN